MCMGNAPLNDKLTLKWFATFLFHFIRSYIKSPEMYGVCEVFFVGCECVNFLTSTQTDRNDHWLRVNFIWGPLKFVMLVRSHFCWMRVCQWFHHKHVDGDDYGLRINFMMSPQICGCWWKILFIGRECVDVLTST